MFFNKKSPRHPGVGVLGFMGRGKGILKKYFGKKWTNLLFKIVSFQANIRDAFFDQKSPENSEVCVSQHQKHTDGHGDSMTNPVQRAKSLEILVTEDTESLYVCR